MRLQWVREQRRKRGLYPGGAATANEFAARVILRDWDGLRDLMDLNLNCPKKTYWRMEAHPCLTCEKPCKRNYCSVGCWNKLFEDQLPLPTPWDGDDWREWFVVIENVDNEVCATCAVPCTLMFCAKHNQ